MANLETSWDDFNNEFAQATLFTELVIGQDNRHSGLPPLKAMLHKVLHFMARRCRKPVLRRKMITMLAEQTRQLDRTGTEVKRSTSHTQIIDAIVRVEESAWSVEDGKDSRVCICKTGCVPGEFICNQHRVAEVYADIQSVTGFEITLRTVGDVVGDRPGHKQLVSASMWG